jgi:hypothetical protein
MVSFPWSWLLLCLTPYPRELASAALIRLLRDLNSTPDTELTAEQRLGLAKIALNEDVGELVLRSSKPLPGLAWRSQYFR